MLIEKCHNKAIMQSAMNQSNQSDCLIPANISVFHTKKNKKAPFFWKCFSGSGALLFIIKL